MTEGMEEAEAGPTNLANNKEEAGGRWSQSNTARHGGGADCLDRGDRGQNAKVTRNNVRSEQGF